MLIFIKTVTGKTFSFDVERAGTILNVKRKIQAMVKISSDQQRLTFCGKTLEDDRTLADYGVGNESTLLVKQKILIRVRLFGSGPVTHFVDLENSDALQRIAFTFGHGQDWCRVSSGLNIEGKCTQSSCTAYAKRVISPKSFRAFDITTERSTCPKCDCTIKASTCGFTDFQWMYSGRKRGSAVEITSEWQVAGDEYERFREAGVCDGSG